MPYIVVGGQCPPDILHQLQQQRRRSLQNLEPRYQVQPGNDN